MNIKLIKGDITTVKVDAIVNAANTSLLGGGGVDGAIHRKGGKAILHECMATRNRQGGCDTGQAVITTGGNLPAAFVIHTVGPIWHGGDHNEEVLLEKCYTNSLLLALEKGIRTIAFPNISTGIYRFPKDKAATIAIHAVQQFEHKALFDRVIFICFDEDNYRIYQRLLS